MILYTMHRAEKGSYFHYSLLADTMLIASISHMLVCTFQIMRISNPALVGLFNDTALRKIIFNYMTAVIQRQKATIKAYGRNKSSLNIISRQE